VKTDTLIGMAIAAIFFLLGIGIYNIGGMSTASDIRRQCETQGSMRLITAGGEALFQCSREKK
jgi:hypothetical protein